MRRLATDAALRETLGRAARDYWRREHTIETMADDYEDLFEVRGVREVPRVHEVRGDETLRELLRPFGIESPL